MLLLRGVLSPFAHPLFTAMTGIAAGIAVEQPQPAWSAVVAVLVGYVVAVGLHALWNGSAALRRRRSLRRRLRVHHGAAVPRHDRPGGLAAAPGAADRRPSSCPASPRPAGSRRARSRCCPAWPGGGAGARRCDSGRARRWPRPSPTTRPRSPSWPSCGPGWPAGRSVADRAVLARAGAGRAVQGAGAGDRAPRGADHGAAPPRRVGVGTATARPTAWPGRIAVLRCSAAGPAPGSARWLAGAPRRVAGRRGEQVSRSATGGTELARGPRGTGAAGGPIRAVAASEPAPPTSRSRTGIAAGFAAGAVALPGPQPGFLRRRADPPAGRPPARGVASGTGPGARRARSCGRTSGPPGGSPRTAAAAVAFRGGSRSPAGRSRRPARPVA